MEKIILNKHHRPKSSNLFKRALTESNNFYDSFNKKNYYFPNIKDKLSKNRLNKSGIKSRNLTPYSNHSFFLSSTPFNYFKNNNNEFYICYNGGPKKKISLSNKKLNLNMSKINSFSNLKKYKLKSNKYPINISTNNQKEKMKYNYIYNHLEEEKNNNKINNINRINNTEQNCNEKKVINNYFKNMKNLKFNFRKIQIHNNCKPFLVDDYRYYAEKYL